MFTIERAAVEDVDLLKQLLSETWVATYADHIVTVFFVIIGSMTTALSDFAEIVTGSSGANNDTGRNFTDDPAVTGI